MQAASGLAIALPLLLVGQILAGEPSATTPASAPTSSPSASKPAIVELSADPPAIRLAGPAARTTLLITGRRADGRLVDLTDEAKLTARDPARFDVAGSQIAVRADGHTTLDVSAAGLKLSLPVEIAGTSQATSISFENDVAPLLSRYGCNSSGCHGKAEGQNGFKLSVFGFDPDADYDALTRQGRGRRVSPALPSDSLLLQKISGRAPHGGGVRIKPDSREYQTLAAWIGGGLPGPAKDEPRVVSLKLSPRERVLDLGAGQRLRATATYSDGRELDVTSLARFQSNQEGLATVDDSGLVRAGQSPGQVAVMASFMGAVDVFTALIPRAESVPDYPSVPQFNFIDSLVYGKLRQLNIVPAELCDDAEFLRRVSIDLAGTLPTAEEARAFLDDPRTDRRAQLVESLLARPEFADYWALQWSDMLRVDRQALGFKGAQAYYRWIRQSLADNKPLDQFARELMTADGPLAEAPAGYFFKAVPKPGAAASTLSQVFLGVRLACAECHHHPADRWSQTDYFGMQAFFTQIGGKTTPRGDALAIAGDPETRHPRTSELVVAHALGQPAPEKLPAGDRRLALADWLTSPSNPFFARNLANRVWAHLLGRGLVEPVDDLRATNPPSNPQLLDALAEHLVGQRFDLRSLIRTIVASRVYQQSSRPNATNDRDEQNYSRALLKRMDAEVLLDAVCQVTGRGEKFAGHPAGCRAIELWDSKTPHYFLKLFGRPSRESACLCERNVEPSVSQVLHLLNSPEIFDKLRHDGGRVARLAAEYSDPNRLVEELYLSIFSRRPTSEERSVALDYLASAPDRRRGCEDLAWSLVNTLEFVFNH